MHKINKKVPKCNAGLLDGPCSLSQVGVTGFLEVCPLLPGCVYFSQVWLRCGAIGTPQSLCASAPPASLQGKVVMDLLFLFSFFKSCTDLAPNLSTGLERLNTNGKPLPAFKTMGVIESRDGKSCRSIGSNWNPVGKKRKERKGKNRLLSIFQLGLYPFGGYYVQSEKLQCQHQPGGARLCQGSHFFSSL